MSAALCAFNRRFRPVSCPLCVRNNTAVINPAYVSIHYKHSVILKAFVSLSILVLRRRQRIRQMFQVSERFSDVVDAYEHALLGLYPRARYLIGWDARVVVWIQALPEWMGDWLFFHLYSNSPPPACVGK